MGAAVIVKDGRAWAAYTELEEYRAGMWRRITEEPHRIAWLSRAVAILRDIPRFTSAMRQALAEWPVSCRVAFDTPTLNKPVWLAHAGACLVDHVPEEFMRLGYWELTEEDKAAADHAAAAVAAEYREPLAHDDLPLFSRNGHGA
jgi:hypothetical protein